MYRYQNQFTECWVLLVLYSPTPLMIEMELPTVVDVFRNHVASADPEPTTCMHSHLNVRCSMRDDGFMRRRDGPVDWEPSMGRGEA